MTMASFFGEWTGRPGTWTKWPMSMLLGKAMAFRNLMRERRLLVEHVLLGHERAPGGRNPSISAERMLAIISEHHCRRLSGIGEQNSHHYHSSRQK